MQTAYNARPFGTTPDKELHVSTPGPAISGLWGWFRIEEAVINRTESRLIALEQRNQAQRSRQRKSVKEPTAVPAAPTPTRKAG